MGFDKFQMGVLGYDNFRHDWYSGIKCEHSFTGKDLWTVIHHNCSSQFEKA